MGCWNNNDWFHDATHYMYGVLRKVSMVCLTFVRAVAVLILS